MKIAFFGTPEFSVPSLNALYKEGAQIEAVITQPDKVFGRKKELKEPAVKEAAKALGLKVLQPNSKKELEEITKKLEVDFFVVIAYGMILSEKVLNTPKIACINSHASMLPQYRGASPIHQSLINEDQETGVSIMQMDNKMDHGGVYKIGKISIEEEDNIISLSKKLSELSANILPNCLREIKEGKLEAKEQKHDQASYCHKIKLEDGIIDWKKSVSSIKKKSLALAVWPGVYTFLAGKKLKLKELKVEQSQDDKQNGEIVIDDKIIKFRAANGYIIPAKLQIEGKQAQTNNDFLNGHKETLAANKYCKDDKES